MDNLKQKTFRAFAWDFTGKLADQGIGFFISIILARLLAPEEFGLLAMVSVVIALASVFIDSGLSMALIQRKEVSEAHYGSVFLFNITIGALLTILFFSLSGFIAEFYNRPELKLIMQVLSFSFIVDSFARAQSAWLVKQLKFGVITKARIVALIISGSFGVTLAFMGFGVWALVFQSMMAAVVTNIYITIFSGFRPKLIYNSYALKELWGFGVKMFLSRILNTISEQIDRLIIGKIFSPAILGYYQRAKSLNGFVIKYTSGSLMSVMFPVLSSVQNDKERYNAIVLKALHVLSFVTFGLVAFLHLEAEDIIIILFGNKWFPAIEYFKILLLGGYGYPLSSLLVNVLSSKGKSGKFLKLEIYKQILFFLNIVIGLYFGLIEYLYGYAIVIFIAVLLNIFFAAKETNILIKNFLLVILKYLVPAFFSNIFIDKILLMYCCDFSFHLFRFLSVSIIYLSIYLFINFIMKNKGFFYIKNEIYSLIRKRIK